jgi:hypothetical protein
MRRRRLRATAVLGTEVGEFSRIRTSRNAVSFLSFASLVLAVVLALWALALFAFGESSPSLKWPMLAPGEASEPGQKVEAAQHTLWARGQTLSTGSHSA